MNRFIIHTLLLACISISNTSIFGQVAFQKKVNIDVEVSTNNEVIHIHTINKGETLYSLARYFDVPVKELMIINNIQENQTIAIGSQLKIAMNKARINTSTERPNNHIPVIYRVKKQETLYTIAKVYFNQAINILNQRNNIKSFIINEGQEIIIGWWPKDNSSNSELIVEQTQQKSPELMDKQPETQNIPRKVKIIEPSMPIASKSSNVERQSLPHQLNRPIELKNPSREVMNRGELDTTNIYNIPEAISIVEVNQPMDSLSMPIESIPLKINSQKGVCMWDKSDPETKQLLAFHRSAKIGSMVQLHYPLTGRTVEVEVIDHIPSDLYDDKIDIIVTKAVALKLGAQDSQIQIKMDYYEE